MATKLTELRRSVVRRFSLLLLASAVVPMVVVGTVYDRYARHLLDQFTGERIQAQLQASASRIGAFVDARTYQLETLATYPGPAAGRPGAAITSMARIEADAADLYGILFFSEGGQLVRAIPGQAASGPPYWADFEVDPATLPRQQRGETTVVGPVAPHDGKAGWLLLQQRLQGGGAIALHVRLASLTELLGTSSAAEVVRPLLRTPAGDFDALGQPTTARGQVVEGPEVLPGWRPCLVVDLDELLRPFNAVRWALLLASVFAAATIAWLLALLAGRLKQRVDLLAQGAEAVARGDFTHRVALEGSDEISLLGDTFNRMAARLGRLVDRTVRMKRLAALGEFSTGVAHEVRNPLATLKTTVQALARLEKDPERAALLASMLQEIDRMGRAMQDILVFGRPRPPERRELALRDVLPDVVTLLAPEAAQRQVALTLGGELGAVVVVVDPDQLRQIMLNLIQNALQACPEGGRVEVRARADEAQAVVEVEDTGPGIAPEKLAQVFEPFFTTKPGGTGLGLSISRQLAELNGGSLALESAEGRGTTARVTLRLRGRSELEPLDG